MARIARVVLPGYPHHIIQRGVRSMAVFFSNDDRHEYVRLLHEQSRRFGVRFLAYCLMNNHVHLVAIPEKRESLARAVGEAHRLYTRGINFREGVRGYLFQGRFYSCPLDERHLLAAVRYVERNPVRARMVKEAWSYEWSSARYHVGLKKDDSLIEGFEMREWVVDWKEFLRSEPPEIEKLRQKVRTGRPCGDNQFVLEAERLTGRQLRPLEAGRPRRNKISK